MSIQQRLADLFQALTQAAQRPQRPQRPQLPPFLLPKLAPGETTDGLVFDPASRHYPQAFRRPDPDLPPADRARWLSAKRSALAHLLRLTLAVPGVREALVLRGSLALTGALGENAREPGDIDWVVRPVALTPQQPAAEGLLRGIEQAWRSQPSRGEIRFDVRAMGRTEIWTYTDAPGVRLFVPWQTGDLPIGVLMMDFVFQQPLRLPPENWSLDLDGEAIAVHCASMEESLAWKILWLVSDSQPQAKDLYDAVMLAERTHLRGEVLYETLRFGDELRCWVSHRNYFSEQLKVCADWDVFAARHPPAAGTLAQWRERLETALAPTLAELRAWIAEGELTPRTFE